MILAFLDSTTERWLPFYPNGQVHERGSLRRKVDGLIFKCSNSEIPFSCAHAGLG